jgi:hypothetical protein
MQRFLVILGLGMATALTACHSKKILVYASSDIQVDNTGKNITVAEGTTHQEKELDFSGGGAVDLAVQSPSGKYTLEASDDGLYIANLKNDTVVGSYQHIGEDNGNPTISQEELKKKIDSLVQLVHGQNVSAGARNYFIPPGKIVRITGEAKSKIFGPFTTIPGGFDAGSVPEIYKFYTNKEVWEIIGKLSKMMGPPGSGEKTDAPSDAGKK